MYIDWLSFEQKDTDYGAQINIHGNIFRGLRHALWKRIRKKKVMKEKQNIKSGLHNLLLYSAFGIYLLILFALLFLKRTSFSAINLVPFKSIINFFDGDMLARAFALNNIMGNIVLFIPLGVYITLFNRNKKVSLNMCLVAFISVIAEIAQYLFRVGVTDIDDVILNTVGGLMGILTFKLIYHFWGEKTRLIIEILAPIAATMVLLSLRLLS